MPKRTWLVTGAAGFIGTHVVAELLARGDEVVGVDNLYSGYRENVECFESFDNWHWVEIDIRNPQLNEIFNEFQPTHVIHLAAVVSVQECEKNRELAQAVNIDAFIQLLVLCKTHQIQQVFYASSSAVYGSNDALPLCETEEVSPISFYGETKVENERDAAQAKLNTIGFRFFNLFGNRQSASGGYAAVIPKWISTLEADEIPTIYGDGSATRDFCHVSHVMKAVDGALNHNLTGHHIFNIGTGHPTSLNSLYQLICDALHKYPEPKYLPWREGDIKHSYADISLAQDVLGFMPDPDLTAQLQDLIAASDSK